MKAKYIGNPADEDGPRRVRFAGLSFPRNVFVDVSEIGEPDQREKLQGKLKDNRFFVVSDDALTTEEKSAAEADATRFTAPKADPFDQDGDGNPGGPVQSEEKEALLQQLEQLAEAHPETKIEFDRRWGVPRLKSALEAAKFEVGED